MTREDLFRAVGEVREEQLIEVEKVEKKVEKAKPAKRQKINWRVYMTMAACLLLIVTIGFSWRQQQIERIEAEQENPLRDTPENMPENTPESIPAEFAYSTNIQISEVENVENDELQKENRLSPDSSVNMQNTRSEPAQTPSVSASEKSDSDQDIMMLDSESDSLWLTPEEILDWNTVIFRGTVRDLQYFQINYNSQGSQDYTVASVEMNEVLRGDALVKGNLYRVLYPGIAGRSTTSLNGDLDRLEIGSQAVFMPQISTKDTGWRSTSNHQDYFCYADLSEFYFSEGRRFLFLNTEDGLSFAREVYLDLNDAETLDDVMNYLRELLEKK